ncbi:hypothetical protein Aksp01_12140 [Akkermansia sp. NBRC 115031]|nr:hypothetical protein Aksp01_12140 [Akkermansia sp. NBRC 115031]
MEKEKDINELDFVGKLKHPCLYQRMVQSQKESLFRPIVFEIDLTTSCNYRCDNCISHSVIGNKSIPIETLLNLIDKSSLYDVRAILFSGGGEPLTYPKFDIAFTKANEKNITTALVTNGYFINKYLDILSEQSSWTRISVDAAKNDTYKILKNTGDDSFKKVISNISNLNKNKKGKVGFSFLMHSPPFSRVSNIDEIYQSARLAKEIGCDYFEIKPILNKFHFLVELPYDTIQKIKDEMDKVNSLITESFRVIYPESFHLVLKGKLSPSEKLYNRCLIITYRLLITPHGIYPCNYFRGDPKHKLFESAEEFCNRWEGILKENIVSSVTPQKECNFFCNRNLMNIYLLNNMDNIISLSNEETKLDYFI